MPCVIKTFVLAALAAVAVGAPVKDGVVAPRRGANWMQNSSFGAFPPGTTEGAFIQFFADADCTSPVNNGFDVKALTCGQYTDPSGDPLYMAAGCLHGASATATCGQDTCPGGCGSSVQADCSTAINAMSGGGSPLLPADAKCFGGSGNNDCVNIEGTSIFIQLKCAE